MTDYKTVYNPDKFLSRKAVLWGAAVDIVIPASCTFMRCGMVGAGGSYDYDNGTTGSATALGCGAAYAFDKFAVTPAEHYTAQVGDTLHSIGNGDALGDSILTKVTGSVVKVKADRGRASTPGATGNCVGSVKRAGQAASSTSVVVGGFPHYTYFGGASGSDDGDTFPLGLGGRGAKLQADLGTYALSAQRGGGGAYRGNWGYYDGTVFSAPPGAGLIVLEFFRSDPGF